MCLTLPFSLRLYGYTDSLTILPHSATIRQFYFWRKGLVPKLSFHIVQRVFVLFHLFSNNNGIVYFYFYMGNACLVEKFSFQFSHLSTFPTCIPLSILYESLFSTFKALQFSGCHETNTQAVETCFLSMHYLLFYLFSVLYN